ncbi:reverse transcriptase domain-containing protein [Tanacetum coccineum]
MFTVYPQYGLSLDTKDLDQTLAFVHEFERSDLMKPGNKVFSITYLVAYALTSSHHSIDYKKKEYIEIDDLFTEIGSVEGSKFATIKPIDETWAIDIAKNKKLIGQKPSTQVKRNKLHIGETPHIGEASSSNISKSMRIMNRDYNGNKDLEIIKNKEMLGDIINRVQLVNICSLDEYTCVYEKNIYKIPLSEHLQWIEAYLMKIPIISEQTIQRWKNEGNVISKNSLAFATRLAKEEITKICDTRYKQKRLKSLSKSCCENIVNMEHLDIGRIKNDKKKSFYKKKFKKKYKTSWKQKRKRFSPGKYFKPTKDPPEKYCPKGKEKKKCRCWTCNEEGHYSNECPKKNQYPTKVKMCRIALLHGYEPIEDIYEDEKDVFCLKKEEIIVTDNSSSSSDDESSD